MCGESCETSRSIGFEVSSCRFDCGIQPRRWAHCAVSSRFELYNNVCRSWITPNLNETVTKGTDYGRTRWCVDTGGFLTFARQTCRFQSLQRRRSPQLSKNLLSGFSWGLWLNNSDSSLAAGSNAPWSGTCLRPYFPFELKILRAHSATTFRSTIRGPLRHQYRLQRSLQPTHSQSIVSPQSSRRVKTNANEADKCF